MTLRTLTSLPLIFFCACAGARHAAGPGALERLKNLAAAAEAAYTANGAFPSSLESLGSSADRTDPWGRQARYEVFNEGRAAALGLDFRLTSAGPDGLFDSLDDISWPPASPAPEEKE